MFEGLPETPQGACVERWLGHRPSLPDGLPCIGPSAATPDVVLAFGHGHAGLAGSARTAQWVAQWLSGRQGAEWTASFGAGRFARAW